MALKALMLRKKLEDAQKALAALAEKETELKTRETELEAAITEAETDEEKAVVEDSVSVYEHDKADYENTKSELERDIAELEDQLAEEERKQDTTPPAENTPKGEERKDERKMSNSVTRNKIFGKMSFEERTKMFEREDVKAFLDATRSAIKEKRAINNVGLTIPEVFLGVLRENLITYSKLYRHVTVRAISGDGRALIMGTVPEAIWTDCCANLNEMDLTFYDMELNCWKVGGYYAICNANLDDSDVDLAAEILLALSQGIGLALDKAILYGTGTRMPLGVVTRLAQTAEPSGYPVTARPWADLHTSNIVSIANTYQDAALFKQLALATGASKGAYARGERVWAMNETTYTNLVANAMSIDASGAIVSGINGTMPVIGGIIEVLNFIPDNVIVGGYYELYTLAERAGSQFASSEHVRFLQDQTVYKGTARYDGAPAIAEAFVVVGIGGVTPSAAMTFAPDTANEDASQD